MYYPKDVKTEFIYADPCGYVGLELSEEIADLCDHSGPCDADIENCLLLPEIRQQFDEISDEQLIECLNEIGIEDYDPETATRHSNESYVLWIACGQYHEEQLLNQ